jgi:hypothetical protein
MHRFYFTLHTLIDTSYSHINPQVARAEAKKQKAAAANAAKKARRQQRAAEEDA